MPSEQAAILVVDDEQSVTDLLSTALEEEGYSCITAITGEDALKKLPMGNIGMVLLDLLLPDISGMDVLRVIKSTYPGIAAIVITASGDAQTAVEAMKIGAVDYITKPFELERINHAIKDVVLQASTVWSNKSVAPGKIVEASDEEVDWTRYLDKIAEGAETRLDSLTGHIMTLTVIETTVGVARSMDIPEDQIEKWEDAQRKHIKRVNILDRLLEQM